MTDADARAGASLVVPDAVALDVPATDKRDCLERLVDLVAATGRVSDREAVLTAVLDREAEGPTGAGGGVAVPHARTGAVDRPTLAFARLRERADFGGPDDADLLVLLVVPAGRDDAHLSTLSRLSSGLLDDSVRERLRAAGSPAEAAGILGEVVE